MLVSRGGQGLRTEKAERFDEESGGMLAVKFSDMQDRLAAMELKEIGAARIHLGPSLRVLTTNVVKAGAERILKAGRLHP